VVAVEDEYFAAIDPAVTPELRQEGLAREVVSRVQRMRKEAGFAVSDRVRLGVTGNDEVEAAVREHQRWIADEVLAREITVGELPDDTHAMQTVDLDGFPVCIALTREA